MPVEPLSATSPTRYLRADLIDPEPSGSRALTWAAWMVIAGGFALLYAGSLELNEAESRLGLALGARPGPFGQVFGAWDPAIWPGQVAAGRLWAWADGGHSPANALRWSAALAGTLLGAILGRRLGARLGTRAALLGALAWFGCLGLIDPSAGFVSTLFAWLASQMGHLPGSFAAPGAVPGVDLIAGLGTVAALDRIVARGSDWGAGLWAALAFLAGGWPPLAVVALTTIVLGRRESSRSWRIALPPLIAFAAWSAWALSVSPRDWAGALCLPLTQKPAWTLALGVAAMSLPWGPLALLAAVRPIREGWDHDGRALVVGWLQVAGAAVLAGTLIPGLAVAARLPALAGLAMAAGACADRVWGADLAPHLRRLAPGIALAMALLWAAFMVPGGTYLGMAVGYYRGIAIALVLLALVALVAAVVAASRGEARWALGAVAAVAIGLKVAHTGIYVPEWNYRLSQGPWGRAIGQWVPPRWPIYTLHTWPAALALATGHSILQLPDERVLPTLPGPRPQFVLLLPEELAFWHKSAPPLLKVRTLQDQMGRERVLARTEGEFAWYRLVKEASKE